MNCPNCQNEYVCPCEACMERTPDKIPWSFTSDETQACPKCGLDKNCNEWLDISWQQYKEKENGTHAE